VKKFINADSYIPMWNSKQHCARWQSVWKHRVAGKLVFKFKKPEGISGAFCIRQILLRQAVL